HHLPATTFNSLGKVVGTAPAKVGWLSTYAGLHRVVVNVPDYIIILCPVSNPVIITFIPPHRPLNSSCLAYFPRCRPFHNTHYLCYPLPLQVLRTPSLA